jgi:hypothetical protein
MAIGGWRRVGGSAFEEAVGECPGADWGGVVVSCEAVEDVLRGGGVGALVWEEEEAVG